MEESCGVKLKALFFILALSTTFFSQSFTKNGLPFIRMGQAASNLALGNTGLAATPSAAGFYYNTATLGSAKEKMFSANLQFLSQDRSIYSLAYTHVTTKKAFFTIAWIHASVDELYQFSSTAVKGEAIDYSDNAIFVGAGVNVTPKLTVALTAKYVVQTIGHSGLNGDYSANTVGVDLSAYYKLSSMLQLGVSFRDLGRSLETNSETFTELVHEEELPKTAAYGFRTSILSFFLKDKQQLQFLMDYIAIEEQDARMHLGLEYQVYPAQFLRFGLEDGEFRAGIGLELKIAKYKLGLDYAYLDSTIEAGSSHVISWVLKL